MEEKELANYLKLLNNMVVFALNKASYILAFSLGREMRKN